MVAESVTSRQKLVEITFGERYPGTPTWRFLHCPLVGKTNCCDLHNAVKKVVIMKWWTEIQYGREKSGKLVHSSKISMFT